MTKLKAAISLLLLLSAALSAATLAFGPRADAGSAVDRQTYATDTYPFDPYSTQPNEPRVGTVLGRTTVHALIHFNLHGLPAQGASLNLADAASTTAINASAATIEACPITQSWSVPITQAKPPAYNCALKVALTGLPGGLWSLPLTELSQYWAHSANDGIALVPIPSANQTWEVDFNPSGTHLASDLGSTQLAGPSSTTISNSVVGTSLPSSPTTEVPSGIASGSVQTTPTQSSVVPAVQPAVHGPALAGLSPTSTRQVAVPAASSAPLSPRATHHHLPWWVWLFFGLALLGTLAIRTRRSVRFDLFVSQKILTLSGKPLAQFLMSTPVGRVTALSVGSLGALAIGGQIIPHGIPTGVVVLGVVLGSLSSLTALGLVLVFRVVRAINMAQAEIGALAATVGAVLVLGEHIPYLLGIPAGIAAAIITGLGVAEVMRRFERAPRLIVMVATIGIAQILAGFEAGLPLLFPHMGSVTALTFPLSTRFAIGPITFNSNHIVALVVVPSLLIGLSGLLSKTSMGRAMRAVADSTERAELVGVPIRAVMRFTWVAAALLSAVASLLTAPILGPTLGVAVGPTALLAPLAAAVIGRMESLPVTFVASIGIGVLEQIVFWSYPASDPIDVVLFAVILLGLLVTRRSTTREHDQGLGQYAAADEPPAIHGLVRQLPSVRMIRLTAGILVLLVALGAPFVLGEANLIVLTYIAIFGIVAVSLVLLTGWSGQVSLGQFAFAGLGATGTAVAITAHHMDLFAALAVGAILAALGAVVVGIPVLRLSGQFAAVTTLAFAVPVSSFLLNPSRFPNLNPSTVARPILLRRFPLENSRTFYFLCAAFLALAFIAVRNLRQGRTGRALLSVRDNDLAAASWSVSPNRLKLTAFVVAGAIAGVAGGLYVVGLRGMPYNGFSPISSLSVFTMVVVGGLGSLEGGLLGAVYVGSVQNLLGGYAQLLATGAGLLVLLMVAPGGLGGLLFRGRDALYGYLAKRAGLDLTPLAAGSTSQLVDTTEITVPPSHGTALLTWESVDAGYGKLQVLFRVRGEVRHGEILALLGTNGAGKSTLLRVLSGTLHGGSGRLRFDGRDIASLSPQQRLRQGIVTIPGGHGVFPSLSVEENLKLFGWTIRRDATKLAASLDKVYDTFPRLRERRHLRASQLSGGEQQMLALSQAFICESRLLLIDELTLGLAPAVVGLLLEVLEDLAASGATIVVVEQSLNTAARIAHRCLFMERGRVRYEGSLADLMGRDDLARAVFLTDRLESPVQESTGVDEPGTPVLEIRNVRKRYGGIAAVNDVSLIVPRGKIVGVIGPNGAGKTTLLDICSGFVIPDTGEVLYHGRNITYSQPETRAEQGLGRMFQSARLVPTLTVREVVAVALDRHVAVREPVSHILRIGAALDSERAVWRRVDELLDKFGLGRFADSRIRELSTGTRRIVELACSFAHRPDLLLLDEPTAGVAQKEAESLAETVRQARAELDLTILVVEHDLAFIASLADRLVCMDVGQVLSTGSPDAVLNDPAVLEAYFGIRPDSGPPGSSRTLNGIEEPRTSAHSSNGHHPDLAPPVLTRSRASARRNDQHDHA